MTTALSPPVHPPLAAMFPPAGTPFVTGTALVAGTFL